MSDLPALSCMVLYKNELAHLQRVVPKLMQVFDDLVMVTNRERSTDGSDEFLESLGVEPKRMEWVEDFSVARQFGLDQCRGDYKMWMDCDDDVMTSRASWAEARLEVRKFLAETNKRYYTHRIYHHDKNDFWVRENWFHKDSRVQVKYPTHELYICEGPGLDFPGGMLDRVNAPLKPDYSGKLWRYFDMLHKYLRDVDPHDSRCKFYLAREFRGPAKAHVALYLDFWETAIKSNRLPCFADDCWTALNLFELRNHIEPARLFDLSEHLIMRHPFEFLGYAVYSMMRCELAPSVENGERYYALLKNRARYSTEFTPFSRGWYFDRALNSCGYYLYRISVKLGSKAMAEKSVEILREANRPDCFPDVANLVRNNLKIGEAWLEGFGEKSHL